MPQIRETSLWKAYGIQQLPGHTISNNFLRNTHGGGNERIEGLGSYNPNWGFFEDRFNQGRQRPVDQENIPSGAALQKTGYPHVYMRNDYDHGAIMGQIGMDQTGGYSYGSAAGPARNPSNPYSDAPELERAALHPVKRGYHARNVSTQSAASRHRLNQRFMGNANYSFEDDTRTDAGISHVAPASDFLYKTPIRESDAEVSRERQEMRREANAAALRSAPPYRGARAGFMSQEMPEVGTFMTRADGPDSVSDAGLSAQLTLTLPKWAFITIAALLGAMFILMILSMFMRM